jgi:hypothetical protein
LRRVEDRRARAVGLAGFLHSPCRYILSTAIDNTKRQALLRQRTLINSHQGSDCFLRPCNDARMTGESVPTVGTTRRS